ncbi:serine/threonine protein kinase, partial [Streptomyces sp. TRM76130]|nr:serine/threonine protein kinase [Streptomyces sp. TRM76130]
MAERSTAAVDVADNSDGESLTAEADQSTADGVANNRERDTDSDEAQASAGTDGPGKASPPELHSGHKLARRYRLEECVTRLDGFSSWRAVDEKLRRAVGVHVLPAEHSRARSVLAAARSSALLGDPRFVQVLDAVEDDDLVYVVHEWL